MDAFVEVVVADLRDVKHDVREILTIQGSQAKVLEEHVRRTDLLETKVDLLKAEVKPLTEREVGRAALTRVAAAISGMLVAGAAAVEIIFHLVNHH